MTNQQLAVLLSNYRYLLGLVMEDIRSSLPDELLVEGKDILGRPYQSAPILSELKRFCGKLNDDIKALELG